MNSDRVFLFDLDGVIVDTEKSYTGFWNNIGTEYLSDDEFGYKIKGQTLKFIYEKYFHNDSSITTDISRKIESYERSMPYPEVPGAFDFLKYLKDNRCRTAIVTSSDIKKMIALYKIFPHLPELVDHVFTSEDFSISKPDPECFITGMNHFGAKPSDTIIFEDSFNGLSAAVNSGAFVVALSTTNKPEALAGKSDIIIPDFQDLSFLSKTEDKIAKK